jgi:arsenate reductase
MKEKVLFLCTGNSARSQMAEAIANALMGAWWEAYSAGTNPAGYVHPLALRALQEINIVHDGRSKSADEFKGTAFDLVVTVCDDAAENCPLWLGRGKKVHLGFPDPAKAEGTEAAAPVAPVMAGSLAKALNDKLLEERSFLVPGLEFGKARCFAVRAVAQSAAVSVESEASAPACITPKDTFPPAAPKSLSAVGSEGAISLIWEANSEADLAGYLVLRSEAGKPPQALTPQPIKETTFRDATVARGVRYLYTVVAVDTAGNRSAASNRVEETAR